MDNLSIDGTMVGFEARLLLNLFEKPITQTVSQGSNAQFEIRCLFENAGHRCRALGIHYRLSISEIEFALASQENMQVC